MTMFTGHGENDHEEEEHIHEICEHENCHCERMAFFYLQ